MSGNKSVRAFTLLILLLSQITTIQSASAATIGSGNCVQEVGSTTGITVTSYSNRCVVKFTSTTGTTWTVPRGVTTVWVLVVAGGGGGGSDEGGGGGAGGYVENQNFAVTSQSTITLDVGTGGVGATDTSGVGGGDGGDSIFGSITADGGGGGGSALNVSSSLKDGRVGGSGGGGAGEDGTYRLGTGGTATAGQGYRGGGGYSTRGGGGGGASEIGNTNGTARGGDGKSTTILDGATSTFFAGGGGGGGGNSGSTVAVAGGIGGGGAGGAGTTCPGDGSANTGGGGGGAGSCTDYSGGDGGTGIIIINYQFDITAPQITSPTTASIGENTATSTTILAISANESTTMTIAVGQDSGDFTLLFSDSITSLLRFALSPDFEGPSDIGANNVYNITVNLEDYSGNTATQAFTITVTDVVESSSISTPTLSSTAFKGITATVSVSLNAHGRVLFTSNGKRIANCIAVKTTGTYPTISASCSWKPTVTGRAVIQARFTPSSNTFNATSSEQLSLIVAKRTTTR